MRKLLIATALTALLPTAALAEKISITNEQAYTLLVSLGELNKGHDVLVKDDKGNTTTHTVQYRFSDVGLVIALAHDVAALTTSQKEYQDAVLIIFNAVKADNAADVDPAHPQQFKPDTPGARAFGDKMRELNSRKIDLDLTKITVDQLNIGPDDDKKNPVPFGVLAGLQPILK